MENSGGEERKIIHEAFETGILIKGFDAILEIIGGAILLFINPATVNRVILALTQHELSEDPGDIVSNYLVNAASHFSVNAQLLGAFYLLSHGIIKIALAAELLKGKLKAYPLAMAVFSIFILYQLYRFSLTHSFWLILISIFDALVIWLTWKEYERRKKDIKIG